MKRGGTAKRVPKSKVRPEEVERRPHEDEVMEEGSKRGKKKQMQTPTAKNPSRVATAPPPSPRSAPGVVLEPDASPLVAAPSPKPRAAPGVSEPVSDASRLVAAQAGVVLERDEPDVAPDFFLAPVRPARRSSLETNPSRRSSEPALDEEDMSDHQSFEEAEGDSLASMLGKGLQFEFMTAHAPADNRGKKADFLFDHCVAVIKTVAEVNFLAAGHGDKGSMLNTVVERLANQGVKWSGQRIQLFMKKALEEYANFLKTNMKDTGNKKKGVAMMREELDAIKRGVDSLELQEELKKRKKEKKEKVRRENEAERNEALADMTQKYGSGEVAAEALDVKEKKRPKVKRQSAESDSDLSTSSKPGRRNKIELEILAAETARADADAAAAVARANAESLRPRW